MARLEVAQEVAGDLDRIVDHLTQHDASRVGERITGLIDAIEVLMHSPLMGRPVREDLRELIVGRAAEGYVVLYRYIPEIDTAFVPAMRAGVFFSKVTATSSATAACRGHPHPSARSRP